MHTIGFSTYGNGQIPIFFIHDWFSDQSYYENIKPFLNSALYKFIFVDLRGYGNSKSIYGKCTVEEAAKDIVSIADQLKISQFHIVGHEMGAFVAQYLPLEAPSRIKSISAICPVPACGSQIPDDAKEHLEGITKGDIINAKAIAQYMTQNRYHDWFYERKALNWFSCSSPAARQAYLHMFCETNVSSIVRGLEIPTLVICGDYDAPAHSADRMQQTIMQDFRNSHLICLPCGHYPMEEVPILLAATLEKFWPDHS